MDFFGNRNYRLNRSFLSCLGQWPLQSTKQRYFFRTATVLILGSIIVPKIIRFVDYLGDLDGMIECLPVLGIHIRSIAKFVNCTVNDKKMKMLTDQIKESWAVRTADFENNILRRYAERGRLLTICYAVYVNTALLLFLSMPLVPIVLDFIVPVNESRERIYPYETEYFLEKNEKYFYILAHAWIAMPFALGILIAYDTMFAVNVHHICSIFAMLGVRLESIGTRSDKNTLRADNGFGRKNDKAYDDIVACIKIHNKAVEITKLLESSGYVCYFIDVGVSMLGTTLTGFMTVKNMDQPGEAVRFGAFTFGEIFRLFYVCWQGHVLMEHSEQIFVNAYNIDWYDMSPRAKKLLILIMIRSTEPCELTAGKIYILSMKNFATAKKSRASITSDFSGKLDETLKTSMSYFTVLLSTQ